MTEPRNHQAQRAPVDKIDRRVKLWLLIVSTTTIALLAAAALRENVFADWRRLRGQYLEILEAKASDERGQAAAQEFEVRLVQNYIPEIGAVDRCLTCHPGVQDPRMTSEPHPFRTHPGRYLELHDPEKFGCTVCHNGQGRATETADAHGRAPFWDFPMLDSTLVRSSCTKCHIEADLFGQDGLIARADGTTKAAGADLLDHGRALVRELGCLGCHAMNGKGGAAGPDLSAEGNKTPHDFSFAHFEKGAPREVAYWLEKHFLDPASVSPGTIMPSIAEAGDADALTAYMLSRRRREIGRYFYTKSRNGVGVESGRDLYARYCSVCHGLEGKGGRVASIRTPTLNQADVLAVASDGFYRTIIEKGRSSTRMPAWGAGYGNLGDDEIDRIVGHLRSWEPEGPRLSDISSRSGDSQTGKQQYQQLCASCHGMNGEGGIGSILNSAPFLAAADDRFLAGSIVNGRPGTAMPSWKQLSARNVSDLLAFLRTWQGTAASTRTELPTMDAGGGDPKTGGELFAARCASCHGREGEGGLGSQLNNPVFLGAASDGLLAATFLARHSPEDSPSVDGHARKAELRDISADNLRDLIAFMRLWEQAANGRNPRPVAERSDRAIASGAEKFGRYCAPCHGSTGRGAIDGPAHFAPALNNPEFLAAADDGLLIATIARGRAGTQMIPFGEGAGGGVALKADDMKDIVSFMRSWQTPQAAGKRESDQQGSGGASVGAAATSVRRGSGIGEG